MTGKSRNKAKNAREKVIQDMADKVMAAIKSGDKPWNKPWDTSKCSTGLAHNVVSGKPYRGVNQFYLSIASSDIEFASFKQWAEVGRKHAISKGEYELTEDAKGKPFKKATEYYGVQKGASSHTVVYYMIFEKENKETGEKERIPVLKWYRVFGRSDTNIPAPPAPEVDPDEMPEFTDHQEDVERQVHEWMTEQGITFGEGGHRAYYRYSADHIQMPDKVAFPSGFSYLPTLLHESVHATGHKSRLDRKMGTGFGSEDYAFEELVAEMGASLLCRHFNILPSDPLEDGLENQVAYMTSWMKRLEKNPRLLIQAGSKAQKAMDFILDTKFEYDDKKEEKVEE